MNCQSMAGAAGLAFAGAALAHHSPAAFDLTQEIVVEGTEEPVIQVIEEATGEILYTVRSQTNRFRPPVYAEGKYTVKVGRDRPDLRTIEGIEPRSREDELAIRVTP